MKVVVALSGGVDSSTLCAYYLDGGDTVIPITFKYGSKHNKFEREAVGSIVKYFRLPKPIEVSLDFIDQYFISSLLLKGKEIPEGHYQDETMKSTVVPGRNLIFLSIMMGYAWSIEASVIAYGAHSGDHAIYEDCRPDFVHAAGLAISKGSGGRVILDVPFLKLAKADIIRIGNLTHPKAPYDLTRTCYKNQPLACGKCGSCIERLEAFNLLGMKDPILYEENHGR